MPMTPARTSSTRHSGLPSAGLPGEEYAILARKQRLEDHFQPRADRMSDYSSSTASSSVPSRSSRNSHLTHEERLRHSEVRYTTRKALGPNFSPSDSAAGYQDSRYNSDWDYQDSGPPIPQKYLDEYNQRWHEDEEDHDADQYIADMTPKAAWRKHQSLRPMYTPNGEYNVSASKSRMGSERRSQAPSKSDLDFRQDVDGSMEEHPRPRLASKFSFDSETSVELSGIRKFRKSIDRYR